MAFTAGQKLKASNLGQLSHTAQYSSGAAQTIGTGADTIVNFATADITSTYVTRATSGAGHKFTLNASGLWAVSSTIRWSATGASATGEKAMHIEDVLGLWHHSTSVPASSTAAITQNLSFVKYLSVNDEIVVECFQNSGGNEDLEYNAFLGWQRINIALVIKDG